MNSLVARMPNGSSIEPILALSAQCEALALNVLQLYERDQSLNSRCTYKGTCLIASSMARRRIEKGIEDNSLPIFERPDLLTALHETRTDLRVAAKNAGFAAIPDPRWGGLDVKLLSLAAAFEAAIAKATRKE